MQVQRPASNPVIMPSSSSSLLPKPIARYSYNNSYNNDQRRSSEICRALLDAAMEVGDISDDDDDEGNAADLLNVRTAFTLRSSRPNNNNNNNNNDDYDDDDDDDDDGEEEEEESEDDDPDYIDSVKGYNKEIDLVFGTFT